MRIAKYIFLLLLLVTATLSVFVATKDGTYFIEKSKVINVPRATVFSYVSDSKNWETYNPWKQEINKVKIQQIFGTDSITKTIAINGVDSEIHIKFNDTLKNTKITWSTKGKLSFKDKFLSIINKGTHNDFAEMFDKGLTDLNTVLTTEINSFNIKMNGFVNRDTIFYIQRPVSCKIEELPAKIKNVLPKLKQLLTATNTAQKGDPFIIYHSKDSLNNKITFSIAIPTKYKIFTSSESDIYSGQTNPFQAVKATVTGNYNHKKEAIDKIFEFMSQNRLEQSDRHKIVEIIPVNSSTEKFASKWITEIYIPVRPKKTTIRVKPVKRDTLNTIIESNFKNPTNP
ncbi:GyrI-like domain-containing protein [Flavobacterium sp.]|uniref:GyrI-like domain-containing protein n=1 Tax=Flavobacterium sp. TaxID=239 RepID=UPI00374D661D